jgi:hypothetical protein
MSPAKKDPKFKAAIALLQGPLKNLAKGEGVNSVETLRKAVRNELTEYERGDNPITPKQVENLRSFMNTTRDWKDYPGQGDTIDSFFGGKS